MEYIDVQHDEGLVQLADLLPRANLSKTAQEILRETNLDEDYTVLIKEAFADQDNRLFPIHTPSQTILSATYINDQSNVIPEIVKTACQNALNEWGIDAVRIEASLDKTAQNNMPPMDEVMLLPSLGKLPVLDEAMLLKLAATLSSHWNQLTIPQKVEGSVQLGKFARIHDVALNNFDSKFNRYGLDANCDLGKLSQEVLIRVSSTEENDSKDKYQAFLRKLAIYKNEHGAMVCTDKDINTSIAYELLELDKQAGLYGPFDAIYDTYNVVSYKEQGGLLKTAQELENTIDELQVGGYNIPLVKIASIFEDDAKHIFAELGNDIVQYGGVNIENLENRLAQIPLSAQNEIAKRINAI